MEYLSTVAAYTVENGEKDGKSMHLAIKTDEGYKACNFNIGVLFPKADFNSGKVAGTTITMDNPVLYRLKNGLVGVKADLSDGKSGFYQAVNFCEYQEISEEEFIFNAEGHFENIEIDGKCIKASVIDIFPGEKNCILKRLTKVVNTSVEPLDLHFYEGKKFHGLASLKAFYSDGSIEYIPVEWNAEDMKKLSSGGKGVYEINGKAVVDELPVPLVEGVADPFMILYEDDYYLIGSTETDGTKNIYIRKAHEIRDFATAEPLLIFEASSEGEFSACNWAPELHIINGRLCCLFAASLTGQWNAVQSRIMYCNGDPTDKNAWSRPVRIKKKNGENLIEKGITLDMTYFEAGNRSYYVWAQRIIDEKGIDSSDLYIAEINPENPEYLMSEPVLLLKPNYAWDRQHTEVVEGPNVLKHDGKIWLSFSGDSVSNFYCLGWLTASENGNLLDPSAWKEQGFPCLGREHVPHEFGPGHNSFVKDRYGRDLIVYHMKYDGGIRSACVRIIKYSSVGTPLLYLTPEDYLKKEYKSVKAKVTIEDRAYLFVHFKEKTTPDGEQVYFGLSTDGFHWEKVNNGLPVLWSFYGDKGVRDFTITRCDRTGLYYIIATDLSLSYGMRTKYKNSWKEVSENGSKYFSVWESSDLLNWSEQKLVYMGEDDFGCMWAPDVIYDEENGDYILHWSSSHKFNNYGPKAIFYSRTKDFKTFTKPQELYRKETSGVIDSAMYEENGKFYLFVKSESNPGGVILLRGDKVTGPFERMTAFEESVALEKAWAYEAPTAMKLEDGRWCVFEDYFGVRGRGQGYVPFVSDDISTGIFRRADEDFSFPYGFKHGTILTISKTDYEKIKSFEGWVE